MEPNEVARRADEVLVVDVRQSEEWEAGRIENSLHVPMDQVAGRLDEIGEDRPVVAVCRSGSRSDKVATFLRARGYDAHNLEGGLLAWVDAGLQLTAPDGEPGQVA